jgi:protein-L-isoaspartate O-methyltransferase
MEDDPRRHDLRAGFDLAAEDYQRTRPVCPPQLFDDLISRAGLEAGDRVIEIGCGTGQATVPSSPARGHSARSGARSSSPG